MDGETVNSMSKASNLGENLCRYLNHDAFIRLFRLLVAELPARDLEQCIVFNVSGFKQKSVRALSGCAMYLTFPSGYDGIIQPYAVTGVHNQASRFIKVFADDEFAM